MFQPLVTARPAPAALLSRREVVIGGLLLIAGALGVVVTMVMESVALERRHGVVLGVLLVLAAGLPLLIRLRTNLLDGPGLYALATVLFFGVTSLAWLGDPLDAGPGLSPDAIGPALVVVAAALAVFTVGARLASGPARRLPSLKFPSWRAPTDTALLVTFGLGLLGTGIGMVTKTYGYAADPQATNQFTALAQPITFLAALSGLAVLATALTYFGSDGKRLGLPLAAFVLIATALGFFIGVKGLAVQPLLFVGLAYVRSRGRVPWVRIVLVAAVTLAVLVPVTDSYRKSLRNEAVSQSQALSQAVSHRPAESAASSLTASFDYVFTRFRLIDSVALIVTNTPRAFPYAGGSRYWSLPALIAVPRALWPEKPAINDSAEFSHSYWEVPQNISTSTPITQSGDLYRSLGLGGVIVGMLIWGLVIGGWQRAYERWRSPRMEMIFLYTLVYFVAYVESDLPQLVATAARSLPFAALVAWLLLPGRHGAPGYRRLMFGSRAS
jgi:hypothetical protein